MMMTTFHKKDSLLVSVNNSFEILGCSVAPTKTSPFFAQKGLKNIYIDMEQFAINEIEAPAGLIEFNDSFHEFNLSAFAQEFELSGLFLQYKKNLSYWAAHEYKNGKNINSMVNKDELLFMFADLIAAEESVADLDPSILERISVAEYMAHGYAFTVLKTQEYELCLDIVGDVQLVKIQYNGDKTISFTWNKKDLKAEFHCYEGKKGFIQDMIFNNQLALGAQADSWLVRLCS